MSELMGKTIPVAIEDEVKSAYLTYAMSVIVSRALPDVRDGLKPVHRRLLFSMDELGLHPNTATKKSARIVGDTMGKYHPHGDAALYDSLVRMAQDFSLRYPLVTGQGNFGSVDGDPPAAMRYTEAKLSKVGDEMNQDLKKETVDFVPNYDESLKEPVVLPAAIPNLLVNGSSGIAVGMATNMAPHNLNEVCEAICHYIENPECSVEELMSFVQGPDFPTGGIIFGRQGIRDAFRTGRGRIIVRGKFSFETSKTGKEAIIFTEIPYQVNKANLLIKISELIRDKVIDAISDLRDESDRDGMRIVIELKKGAIPKVVLNQLFSHTALQSSFNMHNLALVNGRPRCLTLKDLIHHFVEHRVEVVTRRTRFDLRKAEERAHILEGLVIALANIDEVVAIIKASRDTELAKKNLMDRFILSDVQSQAIIDMRLGRLTSLEVEKLKAELEELKTIIAYYKSLLADINKLRALISEETRQVANRFGDTRRTEIVMDEIESINLEDLIKKEEMVILISNIGFIKRVPVSAYRSQSRGGKGMNSAKLVEDDFVKQVFVASTHDHVLFITTEGKAYWLKVHEIPEASRTAKGAHIKALLPVIPNEEVTTIVRLKEFSDEEYLFMATARGVVKRVVTSQFARAKTRGIIAINLDEGDKLVSALHCEANDGVVLISRNGRALSIDSNQVRAMGRASRGVCGLKLSSDDELVGLCRVVADEKMLVLSEYGYGKRVEFAEFTVHGRGTGGQKIYTIQEKTGEVAGCINVRDDDEIMCITSQGKTIKLSANEINIFGRSASGVRVVNIERPDFVIGLDRIAKEEEEEGAEGESDAGESVSVEGESTPQTNETTDTNVDYMDNSEMQE